MSEQRVAKLQMAEQQSIPVSVYVITKNEEENIVRLLDNLRNFAEVIIVDSGSTDRTLELANSYSNTKVSFNQWPGFGEQKAHALSLCTYPWVLNLDADETLSDAYIRELERFIAQDEFVALRSTRILLRWGRQPRSFGKAEQLIRLFKKECGFYETRKVHESISIKGEIKNSDVAILHHENLTYSQRIEKTVFYARLKAEDKFSKGDKTNIFVILLIFPLAFIRTYVFKGHFLDGFGGVLTSVNVALYNYLKYANLWDMNKRARNRE
jgi:glycosyltransferase involved in cell wall biosynthesis